MTTLIFLGTIFSLLIYIGKLILKVIKRKSIASTLRTLVIVVLSYSALWVIFYLISSDKPVPLGTDICFDDWCATVTKVERPEKFGTDKQKVNPKGQFIILKIKMSNHARGIAQKPSEPRVFIIDENGNSYSYSTEGQKELEKEIGSQRPIDHKLELHQSLETQLVFDIPKEAKNLKI